MKSLLLVLKSMVLTLLLVGTALAGDTVNINTADAATLDAVLVGIGAAKAEAIVEYRKANGPFKSAEELAMVKGIGLKTIEKNRERIELRTTAPAPRRAAAGNPRPAQATPAVSRR